MSFSESPLVDVLDFFNGKAPPKTQSGAYPVFGSNGQIGWSDKFNHEQAVIIGRVGAYCGSIELCKGKFWASDNTIVVKPKQDNDLNYLYYKLGSMPLRGYAGGAAQPLLTQGVLKSVKSLFADPETQFEISQILKKYDDLIENNKRRIELLEESARQLYKEWFVRFRFPGHEHVKIIDGVPQGWDKCQVGDLLTLQRGFDLPVKNRIEGSVPIYASTGINGFHNEAKVKAPGIVTGRSGSLGTVLYVSKDYWPLNTALWVKEFKKVTPYYALFFLRSLKLENYNGGAAVPTLNRNDVHRIETFEPPEKLLEAFTDYLSPIFKQIDALVEQNSKLSDARDLLLPKLMSGEIAV